LRNAGQAADSVYDDRGLLIIWYLVFWYAEALGLSGSWS